MFNFLQVEPLTFSEVGNHILSFKLRQRMQHKLGIGSGTNQYAGFKFSLQDRRSQIRLV